VSGSSQQPAASSLEAAWNLAFGVVCLAAASSQQPAAWKQLGSSQLPATKGVLEHHAISITVHAEVQVRSISLVPFFHTTTNFLFIHSLDTFF
jgi:hypothetical protein